ncbi:hypothetical protein HP550_19715 [Cellulomonas humilata]|uniref:Uncharacterized protein n=1 Tax=Cellulomonas humilata TaxID=144055 RepID=A0A7Y6A495_9CELL|nr:hypothetical protein [Cellulomonas humilata]NUU19482.1 hypothetical protein [Cellulomonas humilata]
MTAIAGTKTRALRFAAVAALLVGLFQFGPGSVAPANALGSNRWNVVHSYCNQGYVVQLKFYVIGATGSDGPKVGWGNSAQAASGGNYREFKTNGWHTMNEGMQDMYWIKWASTGDVTSYTKSCVRYF